MTTSTPPGPSTSGGPAAEAPFHWGELDGVPIDFPMWVPRMNAATLSFTVPLDAAQALLPGDGFEVAPAGPDSATFVMALVDYVENPWGDYLEANFGFLAHPRTDPTHVGAFVYRMPVDQEFTCRAGNEVLGLPKTVEELGFGYGAEEVRVELSMRGEAVMVVSVPRARPQADPELTDATTFSYLDGVPTELPLAIELGTGVADPAELRIELGSSPVADELRSLGLPAAPDFAVWGEDLRGVFFLPAR